MATVEKKRQILARTQELPSGSRYVKDLETCEELDQAIQQTCEKLGAHAGARRRRIEEDLKLQYHFGGKDVAYVPSDEGRILIAAGQFGSEAFGSVLERLDPKLRRILIFYSPLPWGESASSLPI